MYYVYILDCIRDGVSVNYYTGQTNNLEVRFRTHLRNAREGNRRKFTGRFDTVRLVWSTTVDTREDAKKLEKAIKRLNREQKTKLIKGEREVPKY